MRKRTIAVVAPAATIGILTEAKQCGLRRHHGWHRYGGRGQPSAGPSHVSHPSTYDQAGTSTRDPVVDAARDATSGGCMRADVERPGRTYSGVGPAGVLSVRTSGARWAGEAT